MSVLGPLALMTVEAAFAMPRPRRTSFGSLRNAIGAVRRAVDRATDETPLRNLPTIRSYPY